MPTLALRGQQRCDGSKPICGRCKRLHKECHFPGGIARRRKVTEVLEARALDLELQVLALCAQHDRQILSHRLFDKLQLLGYLDLSRHTYSQLPMFPFHREARQSAHTHRICGEVSNDDTEEGYKPVIQRSIVENVFDPLTLDEQMEVTPQLSLYLCVHSSLIAGAFELIVCTNYRVLSACRVGLFLPYRSQFQFFMDVSRFLELLALPPESPDSIHPSLLNSIYLAACCLAGGQLTKFEPLFVERTRHWLQQSLAFADRLTHFLWASIVLGSYLARVHRLQESYAIISSASRFALACGLDGSGLDELDYSSDGLAGGSDGTDKWLLRPPKDYTEVLERIRLAHSIYLTDRSLAMLSGFPSAFVFNERWAQTLAVRFIRHFRQQRLSRGGETAPENSNLSSESTSITTFAAAVDEGGDAEEEVSSSPRTGCFIAGARTACTRH